MALRLRGSTSGYAEIDAPAVAGDVTLTLPSTTGTINVKDASGNTEVGTGVTFGNPGANIFTVNNTGGERLRIAADGTVSIPGALNVSGVLTYEDVTSVDAIGLSTFRDGLNTKDVGITTISTSVSDTAVDVFIYDTSKDSDGGEWRKRTSHTSWYNETLNTATRGSRKEFPAVAVIVAEATKVTIYDGDDPDLPMWMIVTGSNNDYAIETEATSIFALNGVLSIGCGGSGFDLYLVKFLEDAAYEYSTGGYRKFVDNIATRSSSTRVSVDLTLQIIDRKINDVAMTVLPNAPIDDATGLPIPTIAVGTNGGLSVVRDDGTVYDLIQNHAEANKVKHVDFDSETNAILWTTDYVTGGTSTSDSYKLNVNPVPSSDITTGSAVVGSFQDWNRTIQAGGNATKPHIQGDTITEFMSNGGNGSYAVSTSGTNQCLNLVYEFPGSTIGSTSELNAMVAYATTSYNTGWMDGDIKGAFLSDTDTTNAVATELIDLTTGSVTADGNWSSIASNTIVAGTTSDTVGRYDTGFTPVSGRQYHATLTISNYTGSGTLGLSGQSGFDSSFRFDANGTYTTTIVGDDSNQVQLFYRNTNTATIGLEMHEAEEDRSVNANGLGIYGTVTKSAVATGADLVGYSFTNASDYLEQPYNSDIGGVGTGDFCVMGWFKNSPQGSTWFDIASAASPRFFVAPMYNADDVWIYLNTSSGTLTWNPGISGITGVSSWQFISVKRVGTTMSVSLNGADWVNNTSTAVGGDLSGGNSVVTIGQNYTHNSTVHTDQLALWRFSQSAPSAEQIKQIYEDEKVLFQENAQATLYGSSDAVTALAYDETTDQLHVGTSSGRSDFQGLRRINNTTQEVQTAISAHDTFIVEQ